MQYLLLNIMCGFYLKKKQKKHLVTFKMNSAVKHTLGLKNEPKSHIGLTSPKQALSCHGNCTAGSQPISNFISN